MDFEWDERKRARMIRDRALDLASAYLFFDGRPVIHQPTPRHGEERWKNDLEDRRSSIHGCLDLAWREHSRDLNEASA